MPIKYEVRVHPEETPIRGNALFSGDKEQDKRVEDEIVARCIAGDQWAWCYVEVIAEFQIGEATYRGFLKAFEREIGS